MKLPNSLLGGFIKSEATPTNYANLTHFPLFIYVSQGVHTGATLCAGRRIRIGWSQPAIGTWSLQPAAFTFIFRGFLNYGDVGFQSAGPFITLGGTGFNYSLNKPLPGVCFY